MKSLLTGWMLVALGALCAVPGSAIEMVTVRGPGGGPTQAMALHAQAELHRALVADEVELGVASPLRIRLDAAEREALRVDDAEDPRQRVGIAKSVGLAVDFEGLTLQGQAQRHRHGAVRRLGNELVWSSAVVVPEASGLRLELSDVNLPRGVELYIYAAPNQAFGPYRWRGPNGSGEFTTHSVLGDRVTLMLRGPAPAMAKASFDLTSVAVLGPEFLSIFPRNELGAQQYCSFNASCIESACGGTSSAVADARDAVAHMIFRSGGGYYVCSGGLLTDTIASETPYFLTANHCISKGREASSLETYFHFTYCSNGSCPQYGSGVPADQQTLGASIVSANRTGDYTLLLLAEPAPADAAYLGWTDQPVSGIDGYSLYRISHPAGGPQAYSEHSVDTGIGTCSSWPRGGWIYSVDTFGATEGGSSGSPVLNAAGQVVGQLSGACGFNPGDACDNSNATVDGAFASYYASVAPYLNPSGCVDADGDGYCSNNDCNDNNAAINPGAAESCSDLVDNDCDGLIDDADPDCGGSCAPLGSSCSENADCCSQKCKGKPGGKSCK